MEKEIILNWSDLRYIKDIQYDSNKVLKGVYIWGFILDSDFTPYYLGVAEDIIYRLMEHMNFLLGGKYAVYHKDYLHEFYKYKHRTETNKGLIYVPYWPSKYDYFIKNWENIIPHIKYMYEHIHFSFAEVNNIERTELFAIETICINRINIEKLHQFRAGNDDPSFKVNHNGNKQIANMLNKKESV